MNKQEQQQAQQQRIMRKAKEKQSPIAGTHPSVLVQRAIADPSSLTSGDVIQLQRTIGNQRTMAILQRATNEDVIQRDTGSSMTVTPHDDAGEKEANSIADQVMENISRMTDEEAYGGEPLHAQRSTEGIQRSTEGIIQRDGPLVGLEGGDVSGDVVSSIRSLKGTGSKVPPQIQRESESAGSPSMTGGEVVKGGKVDKVLEQVGGIAATVDNTMMFHSKAPSFDTDEGKRLLNHENVHRHQQGASH